MIWMYISFGITGIILLIAGIIVVVLENRKKERCIYQSTAIICNANSYSGSGAGNNRRMYHAIYQYEYNGRAYFDESTVGSSIMPEIGKKVAVYINPNNPTEYYIKSFAKTFVYSLLVGLGTFFIILTMVLFFVIEL